MYISHSFLFLSCLLCVVMVVRLINAQITALPQQLPNVKVYWGDKSKKKNVIAPWKQCELLTEQIYLDENDVEIISAIVRFDRKMELPIHKLAIGRSSRQYYPSGTRVLAFRRSIDLPYTVDETHQNDQIYASRNHDPEPYAGMIGCSSNNNCVGSCDGTTSSACNCEKKQFYMVFFDDGHVQKVEWKDIRLVRGNNGLEHGERS